MADSRMYAKSGGEWVPVYPEPDRGVAPVLSAAPAATEIVYTWTAATGITPASYELEFDGVVQNVGAVLTATKTGLTTGQTYTARVRAKTAENVRGEWSNLLSTVAAVPFNAATGGTVTDVTNYNGTGETWRVHTFTANDSLVVNAAPQPFRALACAGGGQGGAAGGGSIGGGGGGGGGVHVVEALNLAVGTYPVVVGAGGNGSPYGSGYGGGSSTLATLSASGGGGGGDSNGDGASSGAPTSHGPGAKNPGWDGGGGGGAGAAGSGRYGGAGLSSNISGADYSYGGGGHGGGNDEGGDWGKNRNYGGGGGGSQKNNPGNYKSPGTAGVVIVAYRIG